MKNLFTDEAKVTAIAEKYFKQTQEASVIEVLDDKGFGFDDNGFIFRRVWVYRQIT